MNMIFPDENSISNPGLLTLIIYIGPEHFSLSLYERRKKGSFYYGELTGENQSDVVSAFKKTFFNNNFLSLPFGKVLIMYCSHVFTYVPSSIYEEKFKEDFLNFHFPENHGMVVNHIVPNTGINVLYQIPEDIYNFMLRSFVKPEFIHYSEPLISYFSEKAKNSNNNRMMVILNNKRLDIFCFSRENFLLGNSFQCSGITEALYYILFIWKQLQFSQLNDFLFIAGNVFFKEELINRLAFYLSQINLMDLPYAYHFEEVNIDRIPFELAALSVCV